jgi:hypothetical protein
MSKYIDKTLYNQWTNLIILLEIVNAPSYLIDEVKKVITAYEGTNINITEFNQMDEIEILFFNQFKNLYSNHVELDGIRGRYLHGIYLDKKLNLNNDLDMDHKYYTEKGWQLFQKAEDFYILRRSIFHMIIAYEMGWTGQNIKELPPTFVFTKYITYKQIVEKFPSRFIEYMQIPHNKQELYRIQNHF